MNVHLETIEAKVEPGNRAVIVPEGSCLVPVEGAEGFRQHVAASSSAMPVRIYPSEGIPSYLRPEFRSNRFYPTVKDMRSAMPAALNASP